MRFLCYFVHRHLDFRLAEIEALARLFGFDGDLCWKKPPGTHSVDSPFYFVELPTEEIAFQIARRSVLLKGIFEIWGEGATHDDVEEKLKSSLSENRLVHLVESKSFKVIVDCFGHVLTMDEQLEHLHRLEYIPFKGRVDLKKPDVTFWVIQSLTHAGNNGLPPPTDPWMCFARQLAMSDRSSVTKFQLPKRAYLGPTAMDAEMALLMANQAHARGGSLVYDPFVGTGSVLVAAAHFGSFTLGADIDIRVVRDGKGPGKNVWANFQQYGLTLPVGLLRADNNCPPWRKDLAEVLDAIVCDPPYGVRAGGRKSGGRKILNGESEAYVIPDRLKEDHIPSTAPYPMAECLFDLVELAARLLVKGGRLVYFFPAAREEYADSQLPAHPCLRLVANSEQILTKRWSRRLVTMQKVEEYTEELAQRAEEKHEEFRVNHKEVLEENRRQIREAVFSPYVDKRGDDDSKRPQYRAKCV